MEIFLQKCDFSIRFSKIVCFLVFDNFLYPFSIFTCQSLPPKLVSDFPQFWRRSLAVGRRFSAGGAGGAVSAVQFHTQSKKADALLDRQPGPRVLITGYLHTYIYTCSYIHTFDKYMDNRGKQLVSVRSKINESKYSTL